MNVGELMKNDFIGISKRGLNDLIKTINDLSFNV